MARLPSNIHTEIARALASGDKEAASKLAGSIAAAQASGDARGFDDDLRALSKLAGGEVMATSAQRAADGGRDAYPPLAKAAPSIGTPETIAARARAACAKMANAEGEAELKAAATDGLAALADIQAHNAFKASLQPSMRKSLIGDRS